MDTSLHVERTRNVDGALQAFIGELASGRETAPNRSGGPSRQRKDAAAAKTIAINAPVTAGEVRVMLEDAYKGSNLAEFERLVAELWTRDRLMVTILREATIGLRSVSPSTAGNGPSKEVLQDILNRAASKTHELALETNELIGVSIAFDRLLRTEYEHSDTRNDATSADAKWQLEYFLEAIIDDVERAAAVQLVALKSPGSSERRYAARLRARRILYECLSGSYSGTVAKHGAQIDISVRRGDRAERMPQAAAPQFMPGPATQDRAPPPSLAQSDSLLRLAKTQNLSLCRDLLFRVSQGTIAAPLRPVSSRAAVIPRQANPDSDGGPTDAKYRPQ